MKEQNQKNKTTKKGNNNSNSNSRDFWVQRAQQKNARVITCNVAETYALADMARFADLGLSLLRKRMMVSIPMDTVVPLLDKFQKNMIEMEKTISEICNAANVDKYSTPRTITKVSEQASTEAGASEIPA